jgi:hypothetical protein
MLRNASNDRGAYVGTTLGSALSRDGSTEWPGEGDTPGGVFHSRLPSLLLLPAPRQTMVPLSGALGSRGWAEDTPRSQGVWPALPDQASMATEDRCFFSLGLNLLSKQTLESRRVHKTTAKTGGYVKPLSSELLQVVGTKLSHQMEGNRPDFFQDYCNRG